MLWYKKGTREILSAGLIMLGLLACASAIGYVFQKNGFPETNIVIIYILAVLLTSRLTHGYLFGIIASVVATFSFNYFFTEPRYTFSVNDPEYIITFVIMTATALVMGAITSRAAQNAEEAQRKEAETRALFQLTDHMTDAKDMEDIAGIAVKAISEIFKCRAACLCFDENGVPEMTFLQQASPYKQVRRKTLNLDEIKYLMGELRTDYHCGEEFYDWPVYGRENVLGIVRIPKEEAVLMNELQLRLLHSMIECMALGMDRFLSHLKQMKSKEETVQERYRGNLLRAISHDLRTPLSGIIGVSEMLMCMTNQEDPRYALADDIRKDADWLHSLVENILSLTRLQDGKLVIVKQLEAVEEIVGSAVAHVVKRYPNYKINVRVPEELMLVLMDGKLIVQVMINLLDNAINHSLPEEEIYVTVAEDKIENLAIFTVKDHGKGIKEEELSVLFQPFFTSRSQLADANRGMGLGLTICDAIVKAHGGSIEAQNNETEQGAQFIFRLSLTKTDEA